MGSAVRTTDAYGGALSQASIDDIRTRIYPGGKIYYADVLSIYNGLFNSAGHTHTFYDQVTLHDYGNYDGGSSAITNTTAGGSNGQGAPGLSPIVYASQISTMQNAALGWENHSHSFTDN